MDGGNREQEGPGVEADGRGISATAPQPKEVLAKTESKMSAAPSQTLSGRVSAASTMALRTASSRALGTAGSAHLSARSSVATLGRGRARSRSAISMPGASYGGSFVSRSSRSPSQMGQLLSDLDPEMQQLLERLTGTTKESGLIAYLSAIPGDPLRRAAPPAAVIEARQHRPKSIMKMKQRNVRFEPTYRLEPIRPFRCDRAQAVLGQALRLGLENFTYSDHYARDACRVLAAYITQVVKSLETQTPGSRYKIATFVTIMEKNRQGAHTELSALWDAERDRYCSATFETSSMVATALLYAVYWD